GVEPGLIFDHVEAHSIDYGNNFINHNLSGYFGELLFAETDSLSNIGYVVVEKWGEWDTLFLLISYDTFDTVQLQNAFNRYEEPLGWLSRGFKSGELFSLVADKTTIKFSNDFGYSWEVKNKLYLNNYSTVNISGGRQNGEVYLLVAYVKQMGDIKHIYIYHSLDYGETFTVHHPFSFGPAPFFIGFDAEPKTGIVPLNVQFTDESSGADLNYAWDFNNDGFYDSYDRNPSFVYADTGHYSVKLKVTNPTNNDSITKYSYIYVKDTTTLVESKKQHEKIKVYPVPANNKLYIKLPFFNRKGSISIFDISGKSVIHKTKIKLINELNINSLKKGIYVVKISYNNTHQYHKFIKN
ncbi:MAG: T9SS type A sorting domain-containing protein, partial [Erysipelotrichia bacterium]|nr:T9SS type A sorting domain-containing protein [Erysipelotrichia bacterium]